MSKFGLTLAQYEQVEKMVVLPLISLGAKVFVFGSRARGNHHPFSDLDILYSETTTASKPIPEVIISKIKEDAEESNLPFKIDLVDSQDLVASYWESVEKDLTPW